MPQNPLAKILSWFDSQPKEIKGTIALFVMPHVPGLGLFEHEDFVPAMREWLQVEGNRMQVVGKAIIFRALVDFTCKGHFTKCPSGDFASDLSRLLVVKMAA